MTLIAVLACTMTRSSRSKPFVTRCQQFRRGSGLSRRRIDRRELLLLPWSFQLVIIYTAPLKFIVSFLRSFLVFPLPRGRCVEFHTGDQISYFLLVAMLSIFPYKFIGIGRCPRITASPTDERLVVIFGSFGYLAAWVLLVEYLLRHDLCSPIDRFEGINVRVWCQV